MILDSGLIHHQPFRASESEMWGCRHVDMFRGSFFLPAQWLEKERKWFTPCHSTSGSYSVCWERPGSLSDNRSGFMSWTARDRRVHKDFKCGRESKSRGNQVSAPRWVTFLFIYFGQKCSSNNKLSHYFTLLPTLYLEEIFTEVNTYLCTEEKPRPLIMAVRRGPFGASAQQLAVVSLPIVQYVRGLAAKDTCEWMLPHTCLLIHHHLVRPAVLCV